jgi:hypothetical protein
VFFAVILRERSDRGISFSAAQLFLVVPMIPRRLEILGAKYEILRFTQDDKKGFSQRSLITIFLLAPGPWPLKRGEGGVGEWKSPRYLASSPLVIDFSGRWDMLNRLETMERLEPHGL